MKKKDEKGVSAVEFALLLPVLVLIIFVIIEGGLVLYNQQVITNASREGARVGILYEQNTDGTRKIKTLADIKQVVDSYASKRLVSFSNAAILNTSLGANGPCTAFNTPAGGLQVNVSYGYYFLVLNSVMGLFGDEAGPSITLRANTTMRCE